MAHPRIVLAGGGHAHLFTLRRTAELVSTGAEVVLVDSYPYLYYSSMATGFVSGEYSLEDIRIDIRKLVESGGGRFVEGTVERVAPEERTIVLSDGREIEYDVASFCLGSVANVSADGVIPVKPVENLTRLRIALSEDSEGRNLLVIGGGAAGCEVAVNAASLAQNAHITLVEAAPDVLTSAPKRARRIMRERIREAGVGVVLGSAVSRFEAGSVILEDGRELSADFVVAATGISPSGVFVRSGVATADDGSMWVDRYLRSVGDGRVFGGGDSIAFRGEPLPRVGVYAIRQGPILFRNLRALISNEPLSEFRPQRRFLYILNLGDGTGLGVYGSLVWRSRAVLALKKRIDERFMDEYRIR